MLFDYYISNAIYLISIMIYNRKEKVIDKAFITKYY